MVPNLDMTIHENRELVPPDITYPQGPVALRPRLELSRRHIRSQLLYEQGKWPGDFRGLIQ